MGHGIYVGIYSPGGKELLSAIPCSEATADFETGDPYFNGGITYSNVNLTALQALVGTTTTWEAFRAAYRACFNEGTEAADSGYFPDPDGGTVDSEPAYWKISDSLDGVYTDAMLDGIVASGIPTDSATYDDSIEGAGYNALAKAYRLGLISLMGNSRTSGGMLDSILGLSNDGDGTVVLGHGCNLIPPYLWVYLYDQADPPDFPEPPAPLSAPVPPAKAFVLARANITGVVNEAMEYYKDYFASLIDKETTDPIKIVLDMNGHKLKNIPLDPP